ncbi:MULTISPECIES: hypothetical protein [unclassified Pseudomonas]|uniref:hypothetical protein n=2 Tax=Pseudomonas TaxID=286 RepID=UPI001A9DCF41|nr:MULTISPECIES: hypothetical protein [unclassified Pseudomonas]
MEYKYFNKTPLWMIALVSIVGVLALIPIANLLVVGYNNLSLGVQTGLSLSELGQMGDFFGGHTSAFSGALSLIVVLFFTFHQAKQQREFFLAQKAEAAQNSDRQFFLDGVNLVTQWEMKSSGADQCMRLLDYYSRLALESSDRELLLILNTVITAQIRKNLEGKNGSFRATNYPYACEAVEKIRILREADSRAHKAKRKENLKP